jgi:tRNA-splicing ligase RtcB
MTETTYNVIKPDNGLPIKAWTKGVPLEDAARQQLLNVAQLPFIYKWVAAMPDVHWGIGATVGSVIPTRGAIIPAAVGVDIGCGMMAVKTSLHANHLPDNLHGIRTAIEKAVRTGVPMAEFQGLLLALEVRGIEQGEGRLDRVAASHGILA